MFTCACPRSSSPNIVADGAVVLGQQHELAVEHSPARQASGGSTACHSAPKIASAKASELAHGREGRRGCVANHWTAVREQAGSERTDSGTARSARAPPRRPPTGRTRAPPSQRDVAGRPRARAREMPSEEPVGRPLADPAERDEALLHLVVGQRGELVQVDSARARPSTYSALRREKPSADSSSSLAVASRSRGGNA